MHVVRIHPVSNFKLLNSLNALVSFKSVVLPNAFCQPLRVQVVQLVVRVKLFLVVVHLCPLLVVLRLHLSLCLLVVEVHVVHVLLCNRQGVFLVEFLHNLHINLVMDLEPLSFDFLLPPLVVDLHVVQDRIDQCPDVRVLVTQKLKNNRNHLGLMQHDFPGRAEKQKFEEGVQYLLHHLIVFLLSTEQVLQELNQVGGCNSLGSFVIAANRPDEHHTFEENVVFSIAVHQMVVEELYQIPLFNFQRPEISWDVDHRAKQLEEKVGVFVCMMS